MKKSVYESHQCEREAFAQENIRFVAGWKPRDYCFTHKIADLTKDSNAISIVGRDFVNESLENRVQYLSPKPSTFKKALCNHGSKKTSLYGDA